ncbi:hypothetical protein [Marisediminicola senii]|uniref:hypothetical protein n=1 Tax=Marisediminicola senii TaxID=2711233 RepID=UPI0013E9CB38|nr:hypothetical protein [Marisediminicola senii]
MTLSDEQTPRQHEAPLSRRQVRDLARDNAPAADGITDEARQRREEAEPRRGSGGRRVRWNPSLGDESENP